MYSDISFPGKKVFDEKDRANGLRIENILYLFELPRSKLLSIMRSSVSIRIDHKNISK